MRLQVDRHLSKKSLTLATASPTQVCKNSRFLTAHNVVTCPRMALCRPGAFAFPGQRHRPRCRSPPPPSRPQKSEGRQG